MWLQSLALSHTLQNADESLSPFVKFSVPAIGKCDPILNCIVLVSYKIELLCNCFLMCGLFYCKLWRDSVIPFSFGDLRMPFSNARLIITWGVLNQRPVPEWKVYWSRGRKSVTSGHRRDFSKANRNLPFLTLSLPHKRFPEHSALPLITFSTTLPNSAMCLLLDFLPTSQHGKTELVPPPTSLKAPQTTHLLGQSSQQDQLLVFV